MTGSASDGEAMQKAAAELGYEVTLAELEQAWAAAQELDVTELESVGGGQNVVNDWCMFGWCCYTVVKHPDDIPDSDPNCFKEYNEQNHSEACWKDYNCVWVNK